MSKPGGSSAVHTTKVGTGSDSERGTYTIIIHSNYLLQSTINEDAEVDSLPPSQIPAEEEQLAGTPGTQLLSTICVNELGIRPQALDRHGSASYWEKLQHDIEEVGKSALIIRPEA